MIKNILNIISSNVVIDIPYRKKIARKLIPESSSTKKYWKLILLLQFLHLPLRNINDRKGMLSYHFIWFLHEGQKDLPLVTLSLLGSRYMQTLQKLPQMLPKINAAR